MAKFCTKCGAQINETSQFCPSCGAPAAPQQGNPQQNTQQTQQQTQQNTQQQTYGYNPPNGGSVFNRAMKQDDFTAQYHPQDIKDNKVMAILSYIGILTLIPYLAEKNSPYTRFHCVQGMYLFLASVANSVVGFLLGFVFGLLPVIGWVLAGVVSFALGLVGIGLFALMILGIVNAATDRAKNLPVIYMIRDRLGWFK